MTNQVMYFLEVVDGQIPAGFIGYNERKLTKKQRDRVLDTTMNAILKLREIDHRVGRKILDVANSYLTFNICKEGVGIVIENEETENPYKITIALGLNGYEDYLELKNNNGEDFIHGGLNCPDLIPLLQMQVCNNF